LHRGKLRTWQRLSASSREQGAWPTFQKGTGVTREALYKALSAEGDPKLSTLLGVLQALDLELHVAAK
jgi:probable addiction module antidote protein